MPRSGVGAGHEEQVREAVRAGALEGLGVISPLLLQRAAAQPGDRERRTRQVHVVSGGEHDRVEMVFDAVAGADAGRADRGDRPVDELAVVALQRGVVVVGDQHAFAARRETGGELPAQPGVLHRRPQVRLAQCGDQPAQRRVPHQRRRARLVSPEQCLTCQLLCGRHFGEQGLDRRGHLDVRAGQHPARGALEHLDEGRRLDQFRHDLHGAGAGADHRHPLARDVEVVIPGRAVDRAAPVGVDAADVGQLVVGQRSGGQHDGAGREALAALGRRGPHAGSLVEAQAGDLGVEPDQRPQPVPVGQLFDVGVDLAARRVHP